MENTCFCYVTTLWVIWNWGSVEMTGLLTCTSWHASLSYNWRHISPWTKVFCLEIYFPLYFSCTFNLLFRNSSFHGFFFFFWKKKFMVWEKVWCGLGVAKSVWALQVFMGWNNHILLYWKPFSFLSKKSEALESSILDLEYESLWTLGVHSL